MEFLNNHGVDCGDLGYCDPDATHVVAIKLSRSEKMLGSIASGKWLLHHSYISMCMKHDKLLVNLLTELIMDDNEPFNLK